ncbi:MAG: formate--phosphoribosylaminoimidazolecarboxamide ligase [Thermoplasmata archaeon]|jgi:5-formaminoimidazole-4-carboxamide-1-(beta)-D-ribofuranosyl 5'-monophosphate synthetase|nr:formate--phosphoribosylaminoimidazolecarboxamide ligase [Candidatus Sysuiplasma jiujiangense]
MVSPKIKKIVEGYSPKDVSVATLCSHSSLQIFHGARKEGLRTIGIAVDRDIRFYDAFPLAKPDEFLTVKSYADIKDLEDELVSRNAIIVPHGSFVEYMGADNFSRFNVPSFGNREVLKWESDRSTQRKWLTSAGISMPEEIKDARNIDRPVLVKYSGAKGGRGAFIAKDYMEFKMGIDYSKQYTIQEYVLGTRYYFHYFYSPLRDEGYRVKSGGSLEMLSIDRRDEANIDELYKLGSVEELKRLGFFPTFVVTGNYSIVVRESLLPKVFEMGEATINRSKELFGGLIGPFALETIVTDKLEIKVFEISSRIVAGTNPFVAGSPYSEMIEPGLSTGRRIAQEIKLGFEKGRLLEIVS